MLTCSRSITSIFLFLNLRCGAPGKHTGYDDTLNMDKHASRYDMRERTSPAIIRMPTIGQIVNRAIRISIQDGDDGDHTS